MQNAADTLFVTGDASFNGGNLSGRLTQGVVIIQGNFVQQCSTNIESYRATTAHRTVFAGTAAQTISFGSCSNGSFFHRAEFANSAGVTFATDAIIQDSAVINGPVTSAVGKNIVLNGDFLDNVGSRWQVANTYIGPNTRSLAGTLKSQVFFTQSTTLGRSLDVDGSVTGSGGSLTLNGKKLSMTGNYSANGGHLLYMQNAADTLFVAGNATFNGGNHSGRLTNGIVIIQGNFTQQCSTNIESYQASTAHRTVFAGSSAQAVTFGSCSNGSYFHRARFANAAGVNFASPVIIQDSTIVNGPVTSAAGMNITLNGEFVDSAGSRWQVANTYIGAGTRSLLGTLKSQVYFTQSTTLGRSLQVDGSVFATGGSLVLGGKKLSMTGNFSASGGSLLYMQNAVDTLLIAGDASFNGANHSGRLTQGVVIVQGNFTQQCSSNIESYQATNSHRTVFAGAALQTVSFGSCSNGSFFHRAHFASATGVKFLNTNIIQDSAVVSTVVTSNAGVNVTLNGEFRDDVGSRWQVANTYIGSGTRSFVGALQTELFFTLSTTLGNALHVVGNVNAAGGSLVLNGKKLSMTGHFSAIGGSLLYMQNAADSLVVGGNALFNGGNHSGRLTSGNVIVSGNFTQQCSTNIESYQSTGTRTVLTGASKTISFGGCSNGSFFHELEIAATAGITSSSSYRVNGDFTNFGNFTVLVGTVDVYGFVRLKAGSTTTNSDGAFLYTQGKLVENNGTVNGFLTPVNR
jgi:hypothetical protein